jgi:hypothetical protein
MVVATFLDSKVIPPEIAKIIVANGYRTYNNGVDWGFFPFASKYFDLPYKQTNSTDEVISALKQNALVVASMGPGYFTRFGHFILLWGLDESNHQILCNDPNSTTRTRATYDLFRSQAANYFIFYEPKGVNTMTQLKDWEIKMGLEALDELNKKGLIANPTEWKQKLGASVPNWLFFVMMDRLAEYTKK